MQRASSVFVRGESFSNGTFRRCRRPKTKAARVSRLAVSFRSSLLEDRHHAEQIGRATAAAAIATAAASATTAAPTRGARLVVGVFIAGSDSGGEDLGLQRLVLHRVEVAGLRVAAG